MAITEFTASAAGVILEWKHCRRPADGFCLFADGYYAAGGINSAGEIEVLAAQESERALPQLPLIAEALKMHVVYTPNEVKDSSFLYFLPG